jgi:hypothetical protein
MENRNSDIKKYISDYFVDEDPDLLAIKERSIEAKLPPIAISEKLGRWQATVPSG